MKSNAMADDRLKVERPRRTEIPGHFIRAFGQWRLNLIAFRKNLK
jgi:hypothetical protein